MKNARGMTCAAAVVLTIALPPMAYAVDAPEDHAAHHPANAAPAPTAPQVDAQMKRMQDMHQQMQAANTPEQRAALMKDHMAAMQGGMTMMAQMSGSPKAAGKQSMGKGSMNERMDMMEMMMQMMMDREPAGPSSMK
jgi:hypothetical protein